MKKNENMQSCSRMIVRTTAVLFFTLLIGCSGSNDLPRIDVSGNISYKGVPVKNGRIVFVPDESNGNTGPTGYAEIKDGAYNTAAEGGKGVISGALKVIIEGYGESSASENSVQIADPPFDKYETTVNLDGNNTQPSLDFSVHQ